MKNLMLLVLLATVVFSSQTVSAQTGKCEKEIPVKAEPVVATRGKDKNIKVAMKGERKFLKNGKIRSRGQMPKCLISMYNDNDQDVDVYVDGNYMGSVRAGQQGVIESLESYANVYSVSVDKKLSWKQTGDCNCIYVFRLEK